MTKSIINPTNNATNSVAKNETNEHSSFKELIKRYNDIATKTKCSNCKEYGNVLMDMATAVAICVIKKCIDPQAKTAVQLDTVSDSGYNPMMLNLYHAIMNDISLLKKTILTSNNNYDTKVNENGDIVRVLKDSTINQIITMSLNDGLDLVNTAALEILEQSKKQLESENVVNLEDVFTAKRLKSYIYYNLEDIDSEKTMIDYDTTPIQQSFKKVRKYIQDNQSVKYDPKSKRSYLSFDCETDAKEIERIYLRLQKYADIGGYESAASGGGYVANEYDVLQFENIASQMNLSPLQAKILYHLYYRNETYSIVAAKLKISKNNVTTNICRIREKAKKIGLTVK